MNQSAYARAVEMFDALIGVPISGAHASPARLIQSAGLAASSGYRHVAALEADGLLRRDETGQYLPGLTAIRTGLRAYGAGHLAPLVQPILVQLRQSTQHTAFLAIARDLDLRMGPHSVGRETKGTKLCRSYSFETVPELSLGVVTETALRHFDGEMPRRLTTLMVPVQSTANAIVILGLVLNSGRTVSATLNQALGHAFVQIAEALDEV